MPGIFWPYLHKWKLAGKITLGIAATVGLLYTSNRIETKDYRELHERPEVIELDSAYKSKQDSLEIDYLFKKDSLNINYQRKLNKLEKKLE